MHIVCTTGDNPTPLAPLIQGQVIPPLAAAILSSSSAIRSEGGGGVAAQHGCVNKGMLVEPPAVVYTDQSRGSCFPSHHHHRIYIYDQLTGTRQVRPPFALGPYMREH